MTNSIRCAGNRLTAQKHCERLINQAARVLHVTLLHGMQCPLEGLGTGRLVSLFQVHALKQRQVVPDDAFAPRFLIARHLCLQACNVTTANCCHGGRTASGCSQQDGPETHNYLSPWRPFGSTALRLRRANGPHSLPHKTNTRQTRTEGAMSRDQRDEGRGCEVRSEHQNRARGGSNPPLVSVSDGLDAPRGGASSAATGEIVVSLSKSVTSSRCHAHAAAAGGRLQGVVQEK